MPATSPLSASPLRVASGRPRAASHVVAEKNAGLVLVVLARHFRSQLGDPDRTADLYAAGLLALVRAAERFDAQRGFAFSTYAGDCIRFALLRRLERERRPCRLPTVSLETPIGVDGAGELSDVIADPQAEVPGAALVAQDGFELHLTGLVDRHQRVLRALYRDEKTPAEVAAEWGCRPDAICRCHQSALKALRRVRAGQEKNGWENGSENGS